MPSRAPQGKYWCFTLNNPTAPELLALTNLSHPEEVSYIIFGKEHHLEKEGFAPTTPHLQGYVEFPSRRALASVKLLLGERVHLERRKGTGLQASDYCRKEDANPYELGAIAVSAQVLRLTREGHISRHWHVGNPNRAAEMCYYESWGFPGMINYEY